jgi:hypothetical protein
MLRRSVRALLAAALAASASIALAGGDKPIQDNSFLLEEAYNQEPGVIQHISLFTRERATGAWAFSFTEEWPAHGQAHQASVTVQVLRAALEGGHETGFGDVLLNYRWQAIGSGDTPVAVAPRVSAVLPTGDWRRSLGTGGVGAQVNLPVSAMLGERFAGHFNLGGTWIPAARTSDGGGTSLAVNLAQGIIWLAHPNVNLMLEAAYTTIEIDRPGPAARVETFFVSPGVRAALNFEFGLQIVGGLAMPFGFGPSAGTRAVLAYVSFEHPNTKEAESR